VGSFLAVIVASRPALLMLFGHGWKSKCGLPVCLSVEPPGSHAPRGNRRLARSACRAGAVL